MSFQEKVHFWIMILIVSVVYWLMFRSFFRFILSNVRMVRAKLRRLRETHGAARDVMQKIKEQRERTRP